MLGQIEAFLRRWLPAFEADQRSYLTVAIGCTGGQHRSVWFAERLAAAFGARAATLVRHRELDGREHGRSRRPGMAELPLFPLRTVLFPGGLLELKIFEARYLDLMSRCMRERAPFGVVALRSGAEARWPRRHGATPRGRHAGRADRGRQHAGRHPAACAAAAAQRFALGATRQQRTASGSAPRRADRRRSGGAARRAPGDSRAGASAEAIAALAAQGARPFLDAASARRRRLGREPLVRDPAAAARGEAAPDDARRSARPARRRRLADARQACAVTPHVARGSRHALRLDGAPSQRFLSGAGRPERAAPRRARTSGRSASREQRARRCAPTSRPGTSSAPAAGASRDASARG